MTGSSGYDVVGDVHGQHDKLVGLLGELGYVSSDSGWSHPDGRQLVFVGDVIDRGVHQRRTLELVRQLIDDGVALMTMGNHEWNAIAYATPHPDDPTTHLRKRVDHHVDQHREFLLDYEVDSDEHGSIVEWFRTLPLWLDLDGLRVVHACWSPGDIQLLARHLDGGRVTDELLILGSQKKPATPEHSAIENVLKGPEVPLDEDQWYLDKGGVVRKHARYKWWSDGPMTLEERAQAVPDMKRPDGTKHPGFEGPIDHAPVEAPPIGGGPIIVGHYWFTGTPAVLSPHVACVDYSAGKGGPLVAYRWSNEPTLSNKFVAFG